MGVKAESQRAVVDDQVRRMLARSAEHVNPWGTGESPAAYAISVSPTTTGTSLVNAGATYTVTSASPGAMTMDANWLVNQARQTKQ